MDSKNLGLAPGRVQQAQMVLPCADLDTTVEFFTAVLGFRVATIFPADAPQAAVIAGHGLRLELRRGADAPSGILRLLCDGLGPARVLTAPNGTRIELVDADPPLVVPPLRSSLVVSEDKGDAVWGTGRAGMLYRDLLPDRQGGSIIASHIRIPEGGPVPDYVHFHKVHFQMIYCYKGWVRVVYEDQGPPFILQPGDCVLQPPGIRHRVLECSAGLEVLELGCPAVHETCADFALELPTATLRPQRDFGGQRFVRHSAATAPWQPWRLPGFVCQDTGIAAATAGLAGVRTVRVRETQDPQLHRHDAKFLFLFVLAGELVLRCAGYADRRLAAGSALALPATLPHAFLQPTPDLELLEVSMPADFRTLPDEAA